MLKIWSVINLQLLSPLILPLRSFCYAISTLTATKQNDTDLPIRQISSFILYYPYGLNLHWSIKKNYIRLDFIEKNSNNWKSSKVTLESGFSRYGILIDARGGIEKFFKLDSYMVTHPNAYTETSRLLNYENT